MFAVSRFSCRCCRDDVPGISRILGERFSSHARAIWATVAFVFFCQLTDLVLHLTGARCQREPGNKCHIAFGCIVNHSFPLSVVQVVHVLNRNDGNCFFSPFNLFNTYLGKSHIFNFSGLYGICHRAEGFFHGHFRIDAVQLPEIDPVPVFRRSKLPSMAFRI